LLGGLPLSGNLIDLAQLRKWHSAAALAPVLAH
jgi:hypothetical protein